MTTLTETGHAEPRPTTAQVKATADRLYEEAESATESYNGAKEKADAAHVRVGSLEDELARKTARLNITRNRLGRLATAQYRSGGIDPAMQLALDSQPDDYLEQAGLVARMSKHQEADLRTLTAQQREIGQLRQEADNTLARLRDNQRQLAAHKRTIEAKLDAARKVLSRLSATERARIGAYDGTEPTRPAVGSGIQGAPSARAARAVSFAYGALGLPYVWGATGPSGYDCSGLTQAAWRAAGASLPRTTYTQINAGTRVTRSQLRPGDLVFFYSGISHVGIYIGNGQMIHAPHTGAPVRIAPVSQMPFAGATRPA